ncbi:MAG: hypothetical protein IJP00_04160 [Firmicutes bacterium]|nr:hypothetical protein [Bacillota bacterium]
MEMMKREDRIGEFLIPHLNDFIFDELSDSYLEKIGVKDVMSQVPVPIRRTELNSITLLAIARNMAFVMGCNPNFEYVENYKAFILTAFDKRFAQGLIADGVDGVQKSDFDYACIQFRAAMIIDPENIDAYYCYGRACKDAYEMGEEEDFIARFKAESIEAFEIVTLKKPDFAEAYYFLGYGYINLGLYVKAKLTWDEFMKLSDDEEKKKEIEERLAQLIDPVEIESGYNLVLSGKYAEGIEVLSKYKEGAYENWWPLWFYMGTAYQGLDMVGEAIENYLKVLKLSPSNLEAMKELVRCYEVVGDAEKVEKYTKKIGVVEENREKDRILAMETKNQKLS